MKLARAFEERRLLLRNVGVRDATIHRAYRGALLLVKKPYAFGTFFGRDVIDILRQRRMLFAVRS